MNLKKYHVLPLGSDGISKINKKFDVLKLIYVGTLDGRDIIKTIEGFSIYLKKYKPTENILYTLIGDGKDIKKLQGYVRNNELEKYINIIGWVPFNKLKPLMDSHNIGVSFVPCTKYFDCQPVTKTFDYLLSGMPVIATNTSENKKVINSLNGILIMDNAKSFSEGIHKITENMDKYDSTIIRNNSKKYNWKYIINDLKVYIDRFI
jgi:glycosyltransferase involved in cell wall biosynthesis